METDKLLKTILGTCNEILWTSGKRVTKLQLNETAAKLLRTRAQYTFHPEQSDFSSMEKGTCIGSFCAMVVEYMPNESNNPCVTYFFDNNEQQKYCEYC